MSKYERILLLGLLLAAGASFYYARQMGTPVVSAQLQALLVQAQTEVLGGRTKTAQCTAHGPLPDRACTPGHIFPDATPAIICVQGYTQTVRNVSANLKKEIYAEYGLKYPQPTGDYEVDHLIPLELGGSNAVANLFPEAAAPPGFHEKDLVENYLHNEVCAGHIPLAAAQVQIATDWLAVYNLLTPDEIDALKAQFHGR